jgi:hypothetical protein
LIYQSGRLFRSAPIRRFRAVTKFVSSANLWASGLEQIYSKFDIVLGIVNDIEPHVLRETEPPAHVYLHDPDIVGREMSGAPLVVLNQQKANGSPMNSPNETH